jgi:3',5'-cyclic AMP phosphodiesterase CpdA
MLVLAHLSDLHMASSPRLAELAGKRGLGFINWERKRKYIHHPEALAALTRDLQACGADHIAVTGDLVNFSLAAEYARARAWLETLGAPHDVTVVPGNHDTYVRGTASAPAASWGDYMRGDDGLQRFPFVRRRAGVALIALSSALPTGLLMATGRLGDSQLLWLAQALQQTRGLFRVVLIHHPPQSPLRHYLRRLTDAADLRRVLAAHGAELLLHGHDHRRALIWLDGPKASKIPAIGVPSASASAEHGSENSAGYSIFRIDGTERGWRCEMIARALAADGTVGEKARQKLYEAP